MRAITNRDRIRCFKCREYDHFAKDCPNSDTEKGKSEQIQQIFNLDEDKTALKVNQYHNIIIIKIDRENVITSQMEQLSIFCNVVNYIQYESNPMNFYDLDVKALHQKNPRKNI